MSVIISYPFVIFSSFDAASKVAAANQDQDDDTEYRVTEISGGRFVIAMFEGGKFVMNL